MVIGFQKEVTPTFMSGEPEFIGSLPIEPKTYGSAVGSYVLYEGTFTDDVYPNRIEQIQWLNFNEEDNKYVNNGETDNAGNPVNLTCVIIFIHDESTALELVDLYSNAIQNEGCDIFNDNSHDQTWEIVGSANGKVRFKFTMEVNPRSGEGGYIIRVWHYQE